MLRRIKRSLPTQLKELGYDISGFTDDDIECFIIEEFLLPINSNALDLMNVLTEEQNKRKEKTKKRKCKKRRIKNKKVKTYRRGNNNSYRQMASSFYKSREWRELRYDILKSQVGKCHLCGRTRKDGVILHCDHIVPLSKDWSKRLDKSNIQILCDDCNIGKLNKDSIDWR